jgi:hypothetical protein
MRRIAAALVAVFLLPATALAQFAPTGYAPLARRVVSGSSDTATAADFQNGIVWKSATASNKSETLPACVASLGGRWVMVADEQGTAATYPIAVTAAAGTVYGAANGYQITSNLGSAVFFCDGAATNWVVRSQFAPGTNVRAVSGTSDTILASDNGNLVTYNNTSAVSVTLPQGGSAGFPDNAYTVMVRNYGAGSVTITPTTSTINNGASSLALAQNQGAILVLDGSGNYQAVLAAIGSGGGSGTVSNCSTADALAYYSATGTTVNCLSGVGSSGQALLSNGSGSAPSFGSVGNVTASSLTTNVLPKATGSAAIGNSSVSDNGTMVSTSEAVATGGLTSTGNVYGPAPSAVTATGNIDPTSTAMCGGVLPYSSVSTGTLTFLSTWPAGCNVSIEATSSGLATIAAGVGATLHTACTTARTRAQYSVIWLHGESTGVVNVSGDCG